AGLFALHPAHVESVAWISERKDVLSTFFGLLTLWAYAKFAQSQAAAVANRESQSGPKSAKVVRGRFTVHGARFYFFSLLFFTFSLMSKPMLVTLPILLFLLDFWPLGRLLTIDSGKGTSGGWRALLLEKVPFLALAAASCVVT